MKTSLIALLIALFNLNCFSQIAINMDSNQPDSSAILDINSTNKGMLIPRLTTVQLLQIDSPATGLLVFNSNSVDFYFYDGDNWLGLHDKQDTIDPDTWVCGMPLQVVEQFYNTIQIGTQCWMAENLNFETGNSWCYQNNSSNCDFYGRLYDWETALGACPIGWHLPSDDEWKILEGNADTQYGVGDPEWNYQGNRGYNAGKRLKSTNGWNSGNGTNAVDFTSLPGGYRGTSGSFSYIGYSCWLWSATEHPIYSSKAWRRTLSYDKDEINRYHYDKESGFSVRCLRDE